MPGEYVSGNYFETLGVRAVAGRMLTPEDAALSRRTGAPTGTARDVLRFFIG
jgi:hypothetical protein